MCERCSRVKNLENKYSGAVFIHASGGSAAEFDLDQYADQVFFVVNGAARKFLEKNICFFAYIFTDESFVAESLELIRNCLHLTNYLFVPFELYQKYLADMAVSEGVEDKFYFINRVNRIHGEKNINDKFFSLKAVFDNELKFDFSLFSAKKNKIGFSKNMSKGYFGARTIPYIALQVIFYLGFESVFLIGVDLSEASGRFYDESPVTTLPTSLDKDYARFILPSFQFMAREIISPNFQVYNLSETSRLPSDVIPKIKYTDLEKILST